MKCLQDGKSGEEYARVEIRDDGRYVFRCSLGHETITILQQQKFEVLFEIGAHAILDGYYREAILSFVSSLEHFYEFSIRVFLERLSQSDVLFQSCWGKISNQSERRIGAFISLWTANFGQVPDLLPQKQVEFRNKVVHQGKIPSREEAMNYGNAVLDVLRPQILILKEKAPSEVRKVVFLPYS